MNMAVTGVITDNMNSRDAKDLASRMLHIDTMTWGSSGAYFTQTNKTYLKFPEAIFYNNESTPVTEASNTVLRTLTKWRYLKANFNLRVAFNTNQYTQGKLIMYFLPLGNLKEVESMTLVRAQQLRHVIIDANSDRDFVEFTIPYQNVYGAMDLVEGTGDIGYIGILPLNKVRNSGNISLNGKVFVSLDTKELSYNNSIGKVNIPTNFIHENLGVSATKKKPSHFTYNAQGEAKDNNNNNNKNSSSSKSSSKKQSNKSDSKSTSKTKSSNETSTSKPKTIVSKKGSDNKKTPNKNSKNRSLDSIKKTTKGQPDLYENFPQRDYTHIDRSKDQPTLLAIAAQETAKSSTLGYDDSRREMSLCEMAKDYGYLCTFNLSTNDNIRDPIFTIPVTPGLINLNAFQSTGGKQGYTPTTVAMATSISNYWKGDVNFKFTMTKTPTHAGRLRIVYLPFSSMGQFQPLMTDKTFSHTLNEMNGQGKGNFVLDLLPNVENYIWEYTDRPNFEISIPFNSIYPKLTSALVDVYGYNVLSPTNPFVSNTPGTSEFNKILNLNTVLGQILIIPETQLVTSQLCAQDVDINLYIKSPNLELYYFNNSKIEWTPNPGTSIFYNGRGEAKYNGKAEAREEGANKNQIEEDVLIHATDDVEAVPMMTGDEPSFPETLGLKMDDISKLIKRPGWNDFGMGNSSGSMYLNLDPSNFQQYPDDKTPINWFSKMYRLYQGEKNYIVKIPKTTPTSTGGGTANEININLDVNPNFDFNFQGEITKLYGLKKGNQNIDPGTFSLMLDKDIMANKAQGQYSYLHNYLQQVKNTDSAAWMIWSDYLYRVFSGTDITVEDFMDDLNSSTIGEVGNLSNYPGSVFYHSEGTSVSTLKELEVSLGYDNATLIQSSVFSPFEEHFHSDIEDDGRWFQMERGFDPIFMPNTEATFYMSETNQMSNPLVGTYFRDGPVGGIYYRITNVNPYDMIINLEPMFDRGTPYTESPVETRSKILSGAYEVWSGTDLNLFPTEPLERDVKFCRIVDVQYGEEEYYTGKYTVNVYEEKESSTVLEQIELDFNDFQSFLGSKITNFNGVDPTAMYPPKGRIYKTKKGLYEHENGKRYKLPEELQMYIKYKVTPLHTHGMYPPHQHNEDGSITCFDMKFDDHYPTYKELATYLYKYYTWLTSADNKHRPGIPLNTFAYMLSFVKEYETDTESFLTRFFEHRVMGKRLFTFSEMDESRMTAVPFSSEAMAYIEDQVKEDDFDLYKARVPGSTTYYAESVPVPVTHMVYGSESQHVHNIKSEFAMQWTESYYGGPYVPVFTPETPVTSVVASTDYTYNEMVKIIAGIQSSVTYVVDHSTTTEVIETNNLFTPYKTGKQGFIGKAIGGLFRFILGKKNRNVPSLIMGGTSMLGDMNVTKAIVAGTKDTTKAIIENAFNIHDFFEAFRENFKENVVPALADIVKDQAQNLLDALDLFGKEFIDVDKIETEPFYPTNVMGNVNMITTKLEGIKPDDPMTQRIGAQATPSANEEDMSAMLSPILKTGAISSYQSSADFTLNNQNKASNSFPTTSVCPIYNNFMTFRIPYYNNSVAQKIGEPGESPIKNTGRACAIVALNSASIRGKSVMTVITPAGNVATPFEYPRKIIIPAYGYNSMDSGDSISDEIYRHNNTSLSTYPSGGVKLGIWAADNFSFGEFIGIPEMSAVFTPMWNNIAYGDPRSIV